MLAYDCVTDKNLWISSLFICSADICQVIQTSAEKYLNLRNLMTILDFTNADHLLSLASIFY